MNNINIDNDSVILVLVRGAPGSGKSTLAKKLKDEFDFVIQENDTFFTKEDGEYNFDIKFHQHAKDLCFEKTKESLSLGQKTVVSNTFTTLEEMNPYIELARAKNIKLNIIEMELQFNNIHSVPDFVVQDKIKKFENHPTAIKVNNEDYKIIVEEVKEEIKPRRRKI